MAGRNQTRLQVTADGRYLLYHESGPFIDPEVRWGPTGNATFKIGSLVVGLDPAEVLESWIHESGAPATFGDSTTDPNYPERSAVIIGTAEAILLEVSGFDQPFTVRVLDKNATATRNEVSEVMSLPFAPSGGGSGGSGGSGGPGGII